MGNQYEGEEKGVEALKNIPDSAKGYINHHLGNSLSSLACCLEVGDTKGSKEMVNHIMNDLKKAGFFQTLGSKRRKIRWILRDLFIKIIKMFYIKKPLNIKINCGKIVSLEEMRDFFEKEIVPIITDSQQECFFGDIKVTKNEIKARQLLDEIFVLDGGMASLYYYFYMNQSLYLYEYKKNEWIDITLTKLTDIECQNIACNYPLSFTEIRAIFPIN